VFEHLESRRLLTTSLSGGILTITGTDKPDQISFARGKESFTVFETTSGNTVQATFKNSQVVKIVINSGDAGDKIIVGKLTISCDISGGKGNDTISAGGGNDTIRGELGNDDMFGSDGRDLLNGGAGGDNMLGGGGKDTVDYNQRTKDLVIGLGTAADDGEVGENDNVRTDLEVVIGGNGNDKISTNSGRSVEFYGRGGNDTLIGGSGADLLDGGDGIDQLIGQAGADIFQSDDGRVDKISGGSGADNGTFDENDTKDTIP
jgi:Ca2+-binding RTX toxin-like protein